MNKDLEEIFKQSSSVTFISGGRDNGKTDFAFRLGEDLMELRIIDMMAGNIGLHKPDPRFQFITYQDDAEEWLKQKGRKIFLIDELGKHLYKMSFMSNMAKQILTLCQLVRKFDAHLIGMAPSKELVNKLFFGTDLLDCHIHKRSKSIAKVVDYKRKDVYTLRRIPRTTIPFITKFVSDWGASNPDSARKGKLGKLTRPQRAAVLYCHFRSLRQVGTVMNISHEAVRDELIKYVNSHNLDLSSVN